MSTQIRTPAVTDDLGALERQLVQSEADVLFHWPPGDQRREPWELSVHARLRAGQRGCALSWLLQTVSRPMHAERRGDLVRYAIDPVAVFADPLHRRIITVLICDHAWRSGRWTDSDARALFTSLPLPTTR